MNPASNPSQSDSGQTLFCFALKQEAAPFQKQIRERNDLTVLITGIGRANARAALCEFLDAALPSRVFTCGFAGGLHPGCNIGDVLFAAQDAGLRDLLRQAGAREAKFLCVDRIATSVGEKHRLRQASLADAVEMESGVIQAICQERGIPCATVRAISDTADEDLPLDFNQLANPDLSLNYGKLALAIATAPSKIPALRRLQQNTRLAAGRLAAVLARALHH